MSELNKVGWSSEKVSQNDVISKVWWPYLPDLEKQDGSSGAQLFPAIINRATLV